MDRLIITNPSAANPRSIVALRHIGAGCLTGQPGPQRRNRASCQNSDPRPKSSSLRICSMLQTPQRFPRAGSQSYPSPAAVAHCYALLRPPRVLIRLGKPVDHPLLHFAEALRKSRNRTTKLATREFARYSTERLARTVLRARSREIRSRNSSNISEGFPPLSEFENVLMYQVLMRGGPRDIRTGGPVGQDCPLKCRQNLARESPKRPTEKISRNSCLHRRCTPSAILSERSQSELVSGAAIESCRIQPVFLMGSSASRENKSSAWVTS